MCDTQCQHDFRLHACLSVSTGLYCKLSYYCFITTSPPQPSSPAPKPVPPRSHYDRAGGLCSVGDRTDQWAVLCPCAVSVLSMTHYHSHGLLVLRNCVEWETPQAYPHPSCEALLQSSGAVSKSRLTSWAPVPNEPYGFCGRKVILNHA